MRFGIYISPLDDPALFGDLAAAVEEAGFESVFLPEHTHTPVDVDQPRPAGSLAHDTFRGADPFIHLAAAATKTEDLRLGTATALLTQRDPIVLAKATSSLDRLSGGRLILGLGAGWNHAELRNHRVDPSQRWSVWREKLDALRTIWTQEVAEFHGDFVSFGPMQQFPKPFQQPHPPVLMSANGPSAVRRAVDAAMDGWQPVLLPGAEPFDVGGRIELLRELEDGAPPMEVTLLDFDESPRPELFEMRRREGVDRLVFRVVAGPAAEFGDRLRTVAAAVAAVR